MANLNQEIDPFIQRQEFDQFIQKQEIDQWLQKQEMDQYIQKQQIDPFIQQQEIDQYIQKQEMDQYMQKQSINQFIQIDQFMQKQQINQFIQKQQIDQLIPRQEINQSIQREEIDQFRQKQDIDQFIQKQQIDQLIQRQQIDHSIQREEIDQFRQKQEIDQLIRRQEIDQFIRLQNERLRFVLQEQSRQEMEKMKTNMKLNAMPLMRQKDEEVSNALRKNMELKDSLRRLVKEHQEWQRIATHNEAVVQSLNSTIGKVRDKVAERHHAGAAMVEDEGSVCGDGNSSPPENELSRCCYCGSNGATRVMFLPCRHLCSCTECEERLVLCPICYTPKKNQMEVFLV